MDTITHTNVTIIFMPHYILLFYTLFINKKKGKLVHFYD